MKFRLPKLPGFLKRALTPDTAAALMGLGQTSKSGMSVTPDTALQVTVALTCVRLIAEGVSRMPIRILKEVPGEENDPVPTRKHWSYALLAQQPTVDLTSMEWRELITASALLRGNGYGFKVRKEGGKPGEISEIIPLLPSWVTVQKPMTRGARARYHVHTDFGLNGYFSPDDILHVRGPMLRNDVLGEDIVSRCAEALGLSLALEQSHARLHANGVRPSGTLSTDQSLNEDAIKTISDRFKDGFAGTVNAGKVPLLDKGLQFKPITMSGVDAQHLETRKFQVEEICRVFNVFPQMVMHNTATNTYASVEAFFGAHLEHTLMPWVVRWENALQRDVLGFDTSYCVKLDAAEFRTPSLDVKSAHLDRMLKAGVIKKNEARRALGMPQIAGLDDQKQEVTPAADPNADPNVKPAPLKVVK